VRKNIKQRRVGCESCPTFPEKFKRGDFWRDVGGLVRAVYFGLSANGHDWPPRQIAGVP